MQDEELSLFIQWENALSDLLDRTLKFPKRVRFTFSTRIDNLALDVVEKIVEARYTREKRELLKSASVSIEKLRVLFRICHDRGYIDHRGFEHVIRNLDEAGRMVGGWIRQQESR